MSKLSRVALSVGAYVAFIVLVNWLFVPEQLIEGVTQWSTNTWMGTLYLANVIVGFVFVLRDYAQREIGHKVLLATLLAGLPVWYLAGPGLAFASLTAFALSEMTDWGVYSFTKRPLQNRSSGGYAGLSTPRRLSLAGRFRYRGGEQSRRRRHRLVSTAPARRERRNRSAGALSPERGSWAKRGLKHSAMA